MHPLSMLAMAPAVFATTMCAGTGPDAGRPPESAAGGQVRLAQAECTGSLCLILTAPRTHLRLAEPLTAVATLVNRSRQTQEVRDPLAPEYGMLALRAQSSRDAQPVLYQPVVRRDGRGRTPRSLAPGESVADAFMVAFGREGWLLGRPGSYRLWAEYPMPDGSRLRSNDLPIEVLPPGTRQEQQAAGMFMAREPSLFFQMRGGEHMEKGTRDLRLLARKYADTYVAPYAELALGISRSHSAFDPETKTFREPDCDSAVSLLQRAVAAVGDPLSAAQGTAALIGCLERLGRHEDAVAAARAFQEAHPKARSLPAISEVVDRALRKE